MTKQAAVTPPAAAKEDQRAARLAVTMSTIAFTICFAVWMMNGVLVTYLDDAQLFAFSQGQFGWLIGVPVLTGALARLPFGILADRYGGRRVFTLLMFGAALPTYMLGSVTTVNGFFWVSLGFGVTGASFAVGVTYIASWYRDRGIGTALGIFGAGNAGAAVTSILGPRLLSWLTDEGRRPEGWRDFPRIYAGALVLTAMLFYLTTRERRSHTADDRPLAQRLAPLKNMRVWRFGLYYFVVFGGFVALSQWMLPYYVNVYEMPLATAGLLAAVFSFPSGVVRAFGGWLSDRLGARRVMYWVLGAILLCCLALCVPRMKILTPGRGVMAKRQGVVTAIDERAITVDQRRYPYRAPPTSEPPATTSSLGLLPSVTSEHAVLVKVGDAVARRDLLARGTTRIDFAANVWVFTTLVLILGIAMGIGKAAVYRHIPDYFPDSVGVTGGIVGVLGGLGGFVCPILFGELLRLTGLWTSCWMFLAAVTFAALVWMHLVIQRLLAERAPELSQVFERPRAEPS